jgi:hypothetical protein
MILISLSGCSNKIPLVTFVQIDTEHNKLNSWKVDNYNQETCKMEGHLLPAEDLVIDGVANKKLHGGVWISFDDYKKLIAYGKTECENSKSTKKTKD